MNKKQLDRLATLVGVLSGIAGVLGTTGYLSPKLAGTITGVSTICLGYLIQKPASEHPNTEDLEK